MDDTTMKVVTTPEEQARMAKRYGQFGGNSQPDPKDPLNKKEEWWEARYRRDPYWWED